MLRDELVAMWNVKLELRICSADMLFSAISSGRFPRLTRRLKKKKFEQNTCYVEGGTFIHITSSQAFKNINYLLLLWLCD